MENLQFKIHKFYLSDVHSVGAYRPQRECNRKLHTVYISYCKNITDTGLAHLSGVQYIKIFECNNITDAALQIFRNANPNILIKKY